MTIQWHTGKQEIECQRCGRASVTVLGYKLFLSSGQGKKARLQAKSGQLKTWWIPSTEAVARSSANSPGTAVEQGLLWSENGVWDWRSRMEILPDRRREKLILEALLVPLNAGVAKCCLHVAWVVPVGALWLTGTAGKHCQTVTLNTKNWADEQTGRQVWEFGCVATPACHDQSNS